jgi:hypothetical protein
MMMMIIKYFTRTQGLAASRSHSFSRHSLSYLVAICRVKLGI